MLIRKDVMQLTMPILIEQTLVMIMGVINAIMAGHLGKEAVSAVGMVDSINNIFIAFFSALAVGGTVVVAQYIGQKKAGMANETTSHAMLSGFTLSVTITIIIFIFRHSLINILFGAAEEQVIVYSLTYLNITLLTYPLIAMTSVACGVLRGAGDTKTPMKVTVIMNLLNIILSYLFMYGIVIRNSHFHLNIPGMGIKGAALGIAAARTIGGVLVLYTLFKGEKIIRLRFNRQFRLDFELLRSIFSVGFPASVESLLFNGGKLINQIFMVGMGTTAIAANYVAGSVFGLINIPGAALSIAATTMVGQHIGRGESDEAKKILVYLIKLASVCLLAVCAVAFPFAHILASFYTDSGDVIDVASGLIRSSAIAMPIIWAVSFILPAGLKGAGDARYTMFVSIFSMWLFRITVGYILGIPLKMGVLGIWLGMYIDWLVRAFLFMFRLRSGKWKEKTVIRSIQNTVADT